MSPQTIFNMHLILGDVAWLLCFRAYLLPKLEALLAVRRRLQSRWNVPAADELPGVPGDDMPIENRQRKHGSTRGQRRRRGRGAQRRHLV